MAPARPDPGPRPLVTCVARGGAVILTIHDSAGQVLTSIRRDDRAALTLAAGLIQAVTEAQRQREQGGGDP